MMKRRIDKKTIREQEKSSDLLGFGEFRESKLGFFTGAAAIKSGLRNGLSATGGSLKVFALARKILLPRGIRASAITEIEDDRARFEAAAQLYGIREENLQSLLKGTFWSLWLYFALCIVSIAWGLHILCTAQDIAGFLDFVFPFFPLLALIPMFLKQALWHHQLRTRSLTKFPAFLKRPHSWLPLSFGGARVLSFLIATVLMTLLVVPVAALASTTSFSVTDTLGSDDLFYRLLQILAPIGAVSMPIDVSPWFLPLADAFAAFNTTLLTIAALMLGWHTISGTVASAYEGEVLGQRWHTIWAPLRVTAGIGSLAPVANGFCAAQILVIQLVVWGGGIANEVWNGYVGYFADEDRLESLMLPDTSSASVVQSSLADIQNNAAARSMLLSTVEKQVCLLSIREIYSKAYNDYAESTGVPRKQPSELVLEDLPKVESQFSYWNRSWWKVLGGSRISAADTTTPVDEGTAFEAIRTGIVRGVITRQSDNSIRTTEGYTRTSVPTAVWDYGEYCGRITMDLSGAEIVEQYLRTVADAEGLDAAALEAQLLSNRDVLRALDAASERVISGYPERNIPGFNNISFRLAYVARTIVASDQSETATEHRSYLEPGGEAERLLAEAYADYRNLMSAVTTDYLNAISDWANGVDVNEFVRAIQSKGWSSAGSFYVTLAKLQQLRWSMPTFLPEVSDIDHSYVATEHAEYRAVLEGGDLNAGTIAAFQNFADSALKNDNDEVIEAFTSSGDNEGWQLVDYFVNLLSDVVFNSFNPDPFNAMLDLVEMGTTIIYYVLIIAGVVFAVSLVSNLTGVVPGVGSAAGAVAEALGALAGPAASVAFIFKMALLVVLAVGVVHAFVLPMIPYVLFLFFVMGMLILTAEALVAAPLWALFHVRLDGQDFVDQVQRPGYMIAFNLLLRPTLAIFGLILSYVVFGAMIWFINETFEIAGKGVLMAAGGLKLIGLLVLLILLTYLHYQVAIRSFSLITSLPDRVTRWFGQGGENLGEEGDSDKSTAFIVGNVSNRVEGLAKAGGMGTGRGPAARGAEKEAGQDASAEAGKRGSLQARRGTSVSRPDPQ